MNEWRRKFEVAVAERNPLLQSLRIAEAFEAIIQRIEELEQMGCTFNDEYQHLNTAIKDLKLVRDLGLDRAA